MSIVTKTAGVVIAATALCGLGSAAALAATPQTAPAAHRATDAAKVGSPMYSRGFHVYNLTSTPMTLESITGDGNFDGRPDVGSVLQPGQMADFEVTWKFLSNQNDEIVYGATNNTGSMHVRLSVNGSDGTPSAAEVWATSLKYYASVPDNGTQIYLEEPVGTTYNLDGSQAQQEATVLNQLCNTPGANATCSFTPTSETKVAGAQHQVGDAFSNPTSLLVDYNLQRSDTVGISDSIGVNVTAGANLFGIVDASISATYQHQWTTTDQFTEGITVHVPGQYKVWLEDSPSMIRDTGNFTITMGNSTWHLNGVSFDSPDPSGNGIWTLCAQSLTGGDVQKTPLS